MNISSLAISISFDLTLKLSDLFPGVWLRRGTEQEVAINLVLI